MAESQPTVPDLPGPPPPWRLRIHPSFRDDTAQQAFEGRIKELIWFVRSIRNLSDELHDTRRSEIAAALGINQFKARGEVFYETELALEQETVRAFFWIDEPLCTFWLLHMSPSGATFRLIESSAHARVARRIRDLKGMNQDSRRRS